MGFREHNWIKFGGTSDIVEITIRDFNGMKRDSFKCNNADDFARAIKTIKEKTNLGRNIQVNLKGEEEEWLDPKFEW